MRVTGVVVLCQGIQVCSLYAFYVCVVYSICVHVRVHSLILRLPNLFSGRERERERERQREREREGREGRRSEGEYVSIDYW